MPVLGKTRLDKLTPKDVQRLHAARRDSMKPASLAKIHAVPRAALSDAERMELVSRNAAKSVRSPRLEAEERRVLTPAEARSSLATVGDDRLEALFVLALTVGRRRGELVALRWEDVNVDAGTMRVRRSAQRVGETLQLVEPKTRNSRRPVPLPRMAVEALKRQRERQDAERADAGQRWKENGLVFASTVGTLMEPRNVTRRFTQLRDKAAMPWLRLHDLRHACATFLLAAGVEPRTVMEILGHSTVRMTMERYGHALPERMRAAADAMDDVMRPTEQDQDDGPADDE